MKDNARHVPGSTRSRRTPSESIRVHSWLAKSTNKMQSKCIQNRKCDFFRFSASTTYNFNAVKCLHFSVAQDGILLYRRMVPGTSDTIPSGAWNLAHAAVPYCASSLCPFALIQGVTNKVLTTGQNRIKPNKT